MSRATRILTELLLTVGALSFSSSFKFCFQLFQGSPLVSQSVLLLGKTEDKSGTVMLTSHSAHHRDTVVVRDLRGSGGSVPLRTEVNPILDQVNQSLV